MSLSFSAGVSGAGIVSASIPAAGIISAVAVSAGIAAASAAVFIPARIRVRGGVRVSRRRVGLVYCAAGADALNIGVCLGFDQFFLADTAYHFMCRAIVVVHILLMILADVTAVPADRAQLEGAVHSAKVRGTLSVTLNN